MRQPRWANDIPLPYGELYGLGQRCLDKVNQIAREFPQRFALDHELLELLRSQAIAIETLSRLLIAAYARLPVDQQGVETAGQVDHIP